MKKIHIALVGAQPVPIYNGIRYINPDKVVYIYSEDTRDALKRLEEEVNIESEKIKLNPVEMTDIEKNVQELADSFSNNDISINISGGTKAWTYFFIEHFGKKQNATIFYVDQNNTIWDMTNKTKTPIPFDMDSHFRLYGNPLKHYVKFADYTEADFKSMQTLERMRRKNYEDFNNLTTQLSKKWANKLTNQKNGKFPLDNGSYVEWEKEEFVRLVLKTRLGFEEQKLESPNAVSLAFNSGWFEYKIARMISKWKHSKEIRMNCIFPPRFDGKENIKFPKNEVDIIVDTGFKPLFVECKTKIFSSNDIDKFRTVVKNYGGMGSKALFVTEVKMTDTQKEKCEESGIISFSLQDEHRRLPVEIALYQLLEKELFGINIK
jgi:hypothetical protein